ncbi:unnamed protein product [Rangifer tarandus platyrhynchus]|uniref:Uncharacterized protein n=2 Tax=Rangifer tarandus platyrhynchus TaxID=3082113 RepID=A0AC59YN27_RANTA|nr:unnamed protein product [Rangifer tarandus platyrhynchus]
MGRAFCARPRSEQPRWLCAWGVHCPGGLCIFVTSPVLAAQLPGGTARALSQVRRVSSGELISGRDTPGRCQPSRIPGRRSQQLGACSQFGGRCRLWGRDCRSPGPPSSGCHTPASLPPEGRAVWQPAWSPLVFAQSFVLSAPGVTVLP